MMELSYILPNTSEFITKLAWVLFVLKIIKSSVYIFLLHYVYLHGLAILGKDAAWTNYGDHLGLDLHDF